MNNKKERDKLLDEVHDFTFSNYDVKLNWFEKRFLNENSGILKVLD